MNWCTTPRRLQERLNGVEVYSAEKLGLNPDAKEVWMDHSSLLVKCIFILFACCRLYALLCLVMKLTEEGQAMSQVRTQVCNALRRTRVLCFYMMHTRLCCVFPIQFQFQFNYILGATGAAKKVILGKICPVYQQHLPKAST